MPCGSCGGKSAAQIARRKVDVPARTQIPKPTQIPKIRTTPTTKTVFKALNATPVKVIKQQLRELKTCPLCGSTLTPTISGTGVRNRKRCLRCNRTFT